MIVLATGLTGNVRNLDETLSHGNSRGTKAPEIRLIIPGAIQNVVEAAVSGHRKISVTDVMTAHSDEVGMNLLRLANEIIAVLTKVDTNDTKTEPSATNLAFRSVILHR